MKVTAILITCLAAVALACPPPLNNPDFLPNATHTTADLLEAALAQVRGLWTDAVKTFENPRDPWPRSGTGTVTTIWYCYADAEAKLELSDTIEAAWLLWRNKIGPPGNNNGHSLEVKEYPIHDPLQPFCYFTLGSNKGRWNANVPDGTLKVQKAGGADPGVAARATMGYQSQGKQDRHALTIATTTTPDAGSVRMIAHEFGHVYGLWHEHRRPDRDNYLHFECKNLQGYDETKRRVEEKGSYAIEEVCTSAWISYLYGFNAAEWSTVEYYFRLDYGYFDPESIMLYDSAAGGD